MRSDHDEIILDKFEEALTQSALSSSTIVNYLADLRAFGRWAKRGESLELSLLQVNQEHVRRYRYYLVQELNRATSTVNRHIMALRKFFIFAKDAGYISLDPTTGVSLVQGNGRPDPKPLSEDDIDKLLSAAQNGPRAGLVRRDLAILQLLVHTGLRVGEVVDLQQDDLIFDDPGVRLRICSSPDENQSRFLPLSGHVCKILNQYLLVRPRSANSKNLFLSQEGRPLSKRTVQRIVSDCSKAAGLEAVSAQTIRRTFARKLLSKTQDLSLVSKRLGHQNKNITEQYLAVHNEGLADQ